MAKKTFGSQPKNQDINSVTAELHKLVGAKFPVRLIFENGVLIGGDYETTWREGGVTTKESIDEHGEPVYENIENYTDHKLTAAQIKKIDAWIEENIAG